MTPQEMNAERDEARQRLAPLGLEVDRCEHAAVDTTALWVMDPATPRRSQIASIVRNDSGARFMWRVSMMSGGVPTTQYQYDSLEECCDYVTGFVESRRKREGRAA